MDEDSAHVVAPDELVEVHGYVLVILPALDNVVPLLQQTSETEEHQEGVSVTKLGRRWKPTENIFVESILISDFVMRHVTCNKL